MTRKSRVRRMTVMLMAVILAGGGVTAGWLRSGDMAQATNGMGLLQAGIGVEMGDLELLAASGSSEIEVLRTNEVQSGDSSITNLWLNWAKQRIVFNWSAKQGRELRSAYFVYRNYEEGITEDEADLAALMLGEEDYKSWASSVIKDGVNVEFGPYAQLSLNDPEALANNLTNQLYYALKFVNPTDTSDYVWLRGKLDYRACGHSPLYEQKTTKCTMDAVDGYYQPTLRDANSMTVLALPEGYEIPDWDTEWQGILQERWVTATETLSNTEKYLQNFAKNMNEVERLLNGLAKTAGEETNTAEIAEGLDEQRQKLADLRAYYDNLFGSKDDGELNDLRTKYEKILAENQEMKAKLEELESGADGDNGDGDSDEFAQLKNENEALKTENEGLKTENEGLRTEVKRLETANEDLQAQNSELQAKNAELGKQITENDGTKCAAGDQAQDSNGDASGGVGQNSATVENNGVSQVSVVTENAGQGAQSVDQNASKTGQDVVTGVVNELAQDNSEDDAEPRVDDEVAVPKLGQSANLNIWLGIALIAMAFGLLAIWVKRLLERQ